MTAKQYLRQIKDLDQHVNNRLSYYERCARDIASLKSPRLDADRVQSSGSGAGFTAAIEKLVDLQAETNKLIDEFIEKRDLIVKQIEQLPEPYSSLLFKKYIEYKDFLVIANELNYNYTWLLELHGFALKMFSNTFGLNSQ